MGKMTYREVLSRASSFLEDHGKEAYSIQFENNGKNLIGSFI